MRLITFTTLLLSFALALPLQAHHIKQSAAKKMPVTTSSPKARELFERALTDYENLYLERANIGWRAAVAGRSQFRPGLRFYRLQQQRSGGSEYGAGKGQAAGRQGLARRTPADPVDHQREGKQFYCRHLRHERHAGDVSQGQAPGLPGRKLVDGTEQLRAGAKDAARRRWPSTRIILRL